MTHCDYLMVCTLLSLNYHEQNQASHIWSTVVGVKTLESSINHAVMHARTHAQAENHTLMHHPLRKSDINDNRNAAQSSSSQTVAAGALSREMNLL